MKKSQAAMEFLMTYGWAILVVLVVIGALAYFGVLSPSSLLPAKCTLPLQMSCKDYRVAGSQISFVVQNGAGRDIRITRVAFKSDALVGGSCTSAGLSTTVSNGKSAEIVVPLCSSLKTGRSKNKYVINITYNWLDSTYSHSMQGELFAPIEPGTGGSSILAGEWLFSSDASDSSGYGNNGVPSGATWQATNCVNPGCYSFNRAANNYIRIPDNDVFTLGSDSFTISMWVNFNSVGPLQTMIAHDDGGGQQNKWILWLNGGTVVFHINGRSFSGVYPIVAPWGPSTGRWYNLVLTRTGSNYSLFVDGVELGRGTDATIIPNPNTDLKIGWSEGGDYFNGLIDEVRFYRSG